MAMSPRASPVNGDSTVMCRAIDRIWIHLGAREPLDGNLTLHKLIDPSTNSSAGYGTALDSMLADLKAAGAVLRTGAALEAVVGALRRLVVASGAASLGVELLLQSPRLNRTSGRDRVVVAVGN